MGLEKYMSAFTTKKTEARESGRPGLDSQYRRIGISALAATLSYTGEQKNEAYAPKKPELTLRDLERITL
jgi:hypothetical protein